ncbi:MAG: Asp-tRNA(Asn)/Glu-tRNA(Gln) amidotransferase subunit GatC [Candidatus Diapherotrites archaeon]|uniref:Aspartyl/glutamyl-tRNA(Asn/Gln) amidotransferase subunit C n=1 Tax=Candidatus Iainarchaeum sp. TaxID=3101447 RepID=A0A8T4LF46_9ARCH|nr:Asp-tRNA(Asn)/Glu-tRNA(Gln) amidotransferase subunit GatC [Candidatus Diapherotrites archaeon]
MTQMIINRDLLEKVAKNARLVLTETEKDELLLQLENILKAFETLNQLDVSKESPAFQPVKLENVFRADVIGKSLDNASALKNAVHKQAPYFKGPRAME